MERRNGQGVLDCAGDVNNEEGMKPYSTANPGIFKKFGAQYFLAPTNSKSLKAVPARAYV